MDSVEFGTAGRVVRSLRDGNAERCLECDFLCLIGRLSCAGKLICCLLSSLSRCSIFFARERGCACKNFNGIRLVGICN